MTGAKSKKTKKGRPSLYTEGVGGENLPAHRQTDLQ